MKKNIRRNKIAWTIIIVGALLITMAIAFFFIPRSSPSAQIVGDTSLKDTPDYAACQLVTTNVIKTADLGERVTAIQEGTRVGVDGLNGEKADACSFPFSTNTSSNNVLTVSVYPYSPSLEAAEKENASARWSEVSGPKPTPYFGRAVIDNDRTSLHMLRVVPGAQTILLSLRQPKDTATFDESDALSFLMSISTKINFASYEKKVVEEVQNRTGDVELPPRPDVPNVESQPRESE